MMMEGTVLSISHRRRCSGIFIGTLPGMFIGTLPGMFIGTLPGMFIGTLPGMFIGDTAPACSSETLLRHVHRRHCSGMFIGDTAPACFLLCSIAEPPVNIKRVEIMVERESQPL